jgi:hypothetical protein
MISVSEYGVILGYNAYVWTIDTIDLALDIPSQKSGNGGPDTWFAETLQCSNQSEEYYLTAWLPLREYCVTSRVLCTVRVTSTGSTIVLTRASQKRLIVCIPSTLSNSFSKCQPLSKSDVSFNLAFSTNSAACATNSRFTGLDSPTSYDVRLSLPELDVVRLRVFGHASCAINTPSYRRTP